MATSEAVRKLMELVNANFSNRPIVTLGEAPRVKVDTFTTGSLILNQLFGGGWPKGKMVELYGKSHSGKTTLCLHAIANAQKFGVCAFIDTEQRADLEYAASLGVDVDNLLFDQPKGGEEAFDRIVALLKSRACSLIVLDSIAHAKPKSITDSELASANIGSHAKLMTKALDRMGKELGNCCVLMSNQIRFDPSGYGSGEFTPGGEAAKFDCDLRVRIQAKPAEKDDEDMPTHNIITAKCYKNSIGGRPFRSALFTIRFGQGVAIADDTLDAGLLSGVITKSGSHHSILHEGKKISIGRSRATTLEWIKQRVRAETLRALIQKTEWYNSKDGSYTKGEPAVEGEAESLLPDGEVSEGVL